MGGQIEIERKEMSKEAETSIAASRKFPGFRFSPTDEELILYYLKKKLEGFEKCVEVISQLDICEFEPWDLPAQAVVKSDQEWFFFSPRSKKYPNGSQSRRATNIGYWKATGKERHVKSGSNVVGTKRTLVFHIGRAPKGERTEWIMHEFCMAEDRQDGLVVCRLRKKSDSHSTESSTVGSSGTNSDYRSEPVGTTAGNEMDETCVKKKSSSSHDSHSIEHMDSASQSNSKVKDGISQPHSFGRAKYGNTEDDLYADILKDNIVQLDECPPTSSQDKTPMVTTTTTVAVTPGLYRQQGQSSIVRSYHTQGTANRRIRLRKLRRVSPRKEELEEHSDENVIADGPTKRKRYLGARILRGPMRLKVPGNRLYVVVIMTAWFVLLFTYASSPELYLW